MTGCSSLYQPVDPTPDAAAKAKLNAAADANIQLGIAYLQKKDVTLAKQKLLDALRVAPDNPAAWYAMGYYLEVTGNNTEANDYYLRAIKLAPKDGNALNNYGTFLCHTGKSKESISYFLAATQDLNYVDTGAAYENAGLCALNIPDLKLAEQYFLKALSNGPMRERSLTELAKIYYKQQNYLVASQTLQKLFAIAKPTPETLLLKAKIEMMLNGKAGAAPYLRQLKEQFPNSPEAKQEKF
jgi:type IV pilus assembly protein PilF